MTARLVLIAATVAALAGCGVDGPPVQPPPAPKTPGVTLSGHATMGVISRI